MKYVATFVSLALFTLPLTASADAISDLQAQVKVLTQVLLDLQQQRAASTVSVPGASSCSAITGTLQQGSSGAAVSQLQQFLARDSSIYPEGTVSGYYGALTLAAVQRFQAKNGIVSTGLPSTTGYGRVGPQTAVAIIAQCGGAGSGAAGDGDTVGGFIQVSPVSGPHPLPVNIEATVNTTNSCIAATYTIDYGDGSSLQQINVPAGACQSLQQTYTHTYSNSGTYSVTLAAGPHSSSATVVVQ